ncbi:MAG: DegQ family serine endoprotease [Candidatus Aminicenantes bacterium]|nr:DegQ family serine endoprotease [Candidatus Aminicenantes bacterium]
MSNGRKHILFFVFILVVGFIAGILLAAPLGFSPRATIQEQIVSDDGQVDHSQVPGLLSQISAAFEDAAAKASSSVVSIFAEQTVEVRSPFGLPDDAFKDFFGEDFFKRFFGTPPQQEQKRTVKSLGSGVIVTEDGYILTNNHVVANAEKLNVVIGDKKTYEAKVIGTDPPTDVAVIKIDANNLPAAKLGNSDAVRVGQWVIAVGNPFQLFHTVTHGIISAKGRSSVGLADYEDFFQTDASINPGNSGGALADTEGNVIGINTAIASPSGGNVGIGFAIPINMAKKVMEDLISKGKVTRGYVGLVPQDINEDLAKALNLSDTMGVLVGDVDRGGPADKAGIKRGDVILEFDGKKVENSTALRNVAALDKPGTAVKVGLIRDGKKMEVTVTLGERPREGAGGQAPREQQTQPQTSRKLGLSVQTLTPDIAEQLGYQEDSGVVVANVASGSPAEDAGLRRGDLIKEVNRKEVRTVQDFERETKDLKGGDVLALLVRRGQNTFFSTIKVR